MHEGKMVQTGACHKTHPKESKKPLPNTKDSVESEPYSGVCALKEGDVFIAAPRNGVNSAFRPKTINERLEIKDHLADFSKPVGSAFLQKGFNSNLEIPGYNEPILNGKGFSFNPNPNER